MLAPITEPYNPHALTPQQEAFVLAYVEHGNGAESHRQAYPGDYGRRSRHGARWGEQKKRGERARELLMKPKVAARIAELLPQRIADLARMAEHDDEARQLADLLRARLDNLRIRHPAPRLQPPAPAAAPQTLAADQIADLARIAARDDMPASVRREALAAVWPQLETLRRALAGT